MRRCCGRRGYIVLMDAESLPIRRRGGLTPLRRACFHAIVTVAHPFRFGEIRAVRRKRETIES
jgi:hypothetical protein